MMREEFFSTSESETLLLAERFAASLPPRSVVALLGTLGAGKTLFMRGICRAFHCEEQLSSPTFSLMNIYEGELNGQAVSVHHFDLYRLESERELEAIGFDDYLTSADLSVVEWADLFPHYKGRYTATVLLEYAGERERRIIIERGN